MATYRAPVEDSLFLLNDVLRVQDQSAIPGYPLLTRELCLDILNAAGRFHEEVLFPVGVTGDAEGARLVDGHVRTPSGYREAWRAYREAGWLQLSVPEDIGGAGLPAILGTVIGEMRITASHSLAMYGSFCPAAARMLAALGDPWMREHIVPRLVSGEWTATMCLTESHCGTDLRQIRTRAVEQADGSWRLDGTKIFISGGDHDLTENIIHIVLAKVPEPDGSVSAGLGSINVFVVSKHAIDPTTGALGQKNGVGVSSIEQKMGIEGSATCVLNFEGAQAWRISGRSESGSASNMAPMFLLMNYARVSTALSGVGYAELACQNATAYARDRLAGRAPGGARYPEMAGDPLLVQPDIRRLLMGARAFAEGGRATALRVAMWQAEAESAADEVRKLAARDLVDVLTPVMKAYFTDRGFEATNACLQVLGGHGYVREYGLEQMVRNSRIGQIYEGANGIQAIDLVQRKLPAGNWRAASTFLQHLDQFCAAYQEEEELHPFVLPLKRYTGMLRDVFELLKERSKAAPEHNLAFAYDVLQACGVIAIGWSWAEIAVALLAKDTTAPHLKKRKLALARFWMERELPSVEALRERISAQDPAVLALDNEDF